MLDQMGPSLIFRRRSQFEKKAMGSYYLIPLLRQLEAHVVSHCFGSLVVHTPDILLSKSPKMYMSFLAYFDINFRTLLSDHTWTHRSFHHRNSEDNDLENLEEIIMESSSSSSEGYESDDPDGGNPFPTGYESTYLALFIDSPIWDQVKTHVNVSTTRPKAIHGLCDEANFVRSYLPETMSFILCESSQEQAALYCLRFIISKHITEDVRAAFIDLFFPSLVRAKLRSTPLESSIRTLITQYPTVYNILPSKTQKEIRRYLAGVPSISMLWHCNLPDCAICRTD